MKVKRKIGYCIMICLMIICITNSTYARVRYASGIGTEKFKFLSTDDEVTTINLVKDAISYLKEAGYTEAYQHIDPSYSLFASNMIGAEVIELCSHGGYSSMPFKSYVGITTGATRMQGSYQYIGLDFKT